ncbi:MAG: DUF4325 domain-containing protein, partial [Proteobacteria bacterium]|nr:DUF4325 domain-containing protein [Pseudomonadota bacterium]
GQAFADQIFRVFTNKHPDVHLKMINTSVDVKNLRYKSNRKLVDGRFVDPSVQKNVDLDIRLINFYDEQLSVLGNITRH